MVRGGGGVREPPGGGSLREGWARRKSLLGVQRLLGECCVGAGLSSAAGAWGHHAAAAERQLPTGGTGMLECLGGMLTGTALAVCPASAICGAPWLVAAVQQHARAGWVCGAGGVSAWCEAHMCLAPSSTEREGSQTMCRKVNNTSLYCGFKTCTVLSPNPCANWAAVAPL